MFTDIRGFTSRCEGLLTYRVTAQVGDRTVTTTVCGAPLAPTLTPHLAACLRALAARDAEEGRPVSAR